METTETQTAPYTPGPWKVVPNRIGVDGATDYRLSVVKDDEVAPEIAQIYTDGVSDAQAEADARLIAAAPEMFSMVEYLAKDDCVYGGNYEDGCSGPAMAEERCMPCEARALLTRIEGEG